LEQSHGLFQTPCELLVTLACIPERLSEGDSYGAAPWPPVSRRKHPLHTLDAHGINRHPCFFSDE